MSDIRVGIKITGDGSNAVLSITGVESKLRGLSTTADKANQSITSGFRMMRNALASVGAGLSVRELARVADTYTGLNARLKLVSGTTSEFTKAQSELFTMSQRNMSALAETTQLYTRLAASLRDMGRSQSDTLSMTNLIGQSLRISGTDAAGAAAGILQFGQAMASGVLRGDEFNSMMENSPRLARAIADGLGVPIGALRKMAEQGELTAEKVINAILSQSQTIQREYSNMPLTISGAMTQISNSWTRYIGETDQANGSSRQFAEGLILISKNLDMLMTPVATAVHGWGLLLKMVKSVSAAIRETFSLDANAGSSSQLQKLQEYKDRFGINQAVSREELDQRKKQQAEYFDGIRRGAETATTALKGLSAEQQRVATLIVDTAKSAKLDPALALAVAKAESRFNQSARSPVGAIGVMQLMPGTARGLGVDPTNEQQNIAGGIKYLRQLQSEFKSLTEIAAAYNSGPGNVRKYGGVPPFAETQKYVKEVAKNYQQFQQLLGQSDGFDLAREQADQLGREFERLKTHQDDLIKAAEEASKLQIEQSKTALSGIEAERAALERRTKTELDAATTQDQRLSIVSKAAAEEEALNARSLDLMRQQFDAQQRAIEARKSAYQNELAQADRYNLTQQDRIKLAAEIRNADNDLLILAQNRQQAEIESGAKANGYQQQGLDLKQKERDFIANINDELEYQQKLYELLAAAKAQGATTPQLNQIASISDQMRTAGGAVSAQELDGLRSRVDLLEAVKQKNQQILEVDQQVREEQLRINQAYQEATDQARLFAQQATSSFGAVGSAIGKMVVGIAQFAQQSMQVQRDLSTALESLRKSGKYSPEREADIQMQYATKAAQYQIGLYGNMTDAAQGFFEEGSKGYNALALASKAFRAFEMALAIKSALMQIFTNQQVLLSDTARTGVEVANSAVRGQAKATEAVANEGSAGDPYTAFARVAAMAALMAAVGFGVLGATAGGSGTIATAADRQRKQGAGTVFGDAEAQSESIVKSLEIIRDNSSNDLNYSAAMLRSLQNIESAMGGVTNSIVQNISAQVNPGQLGSSKLFSGSLFSSVKKEVSDYGIQSMAQRLFELLSKGFQGQTYTDIKRTTKIFGMTIGESVKTQFGNLPGEVARQFTKVFQSIVDALKEGGKAFGLSGRDFNKRLRNFVVDMGQISVKGLSGEELQRQINALFSKQSDLMAQKFMPRLGPFRQVGEGYFQTFVRVAEGINRANGELERLGVNAIGFRDIVNKQGDVAAEIVRQSLLAQEGLSAGVRTYIDELTGSAEDIIDAYQKLRTAVDAMKTAGLHVERLSRAMINAAGGLQSFTEAMQAYNKNFLSAEEQRAGAIRQMSDAFSSMNLIMPRSKAEFRSLVESIDISTEAGQKLFGRIIGLSDAFSSLFDTMDTGKDALKQAYDATKTLISGLREYVQGLKSSTQAPGSPMDRYNAARQAYESTLGRARGGDLQAAQQLQTVAGAFLSISQQYFAGTSRYAADYEQVTSGLTAFADAQQTQVDLAQQQVSWLESIDTGVKTLAQALADYLSGSAGGLLPAGGGNKPIGEINAGNNAGADAAAREAQRKQAAQDYEDRLNVLQRRYRVAASNGAKRQAASLLDQIDELIAEIEQSAYALHAVNSKPKGGRRNDRWTVQLRAMGGRTDRGYVIAGENGPELVKFDSGASVSNARRTRELLTLGSQDLAAQIAGLRAELAGLSEAGDKLDSIRRELAALVATQSAVNPQLARHVEASSEYYQKQGRAAFLALNR